MGEVDGIFVTGAECGVVWRVCGGSGEGLKGSSIVGDDFYHDEGWRGWSSSCWYGFRHGSECGAENVVRHKIV
jgi:hypothetical protein